MHPAVTPGDEISRDSRGILDSGRMRETVDFTRRDPPEPLRGVVQWFWTVTWALPPGQEFVQPVLSHPAANLSVGPASTRGEPHDDVEGTVVGVQTRVDRRRLRGAGRNVAAKLEVGALGLLVPDAMALTDRIVPWSQILPGVPLGALVRSLESDGVDVDAQTEHLMSGLARLVADLPTEQRRVNREVVDVASLVETDRSIRGVADLARRSGHSARTLQRAFRRHVGASPLWVIRRFRVIDAADAARDGRPPSWSEVAADLGYADQAHLVREFRAMTGTTPSAYARSVTGLVTPNG